MSRPLLALSLALGAGALAGENTGAAAAAALLALAAVLLVLALRAPVRAALPALGFAALAIGAAGAAAESLAYDRAPLRRWLAADPGQADPVRLEGVAAEDGRAELDRWTLIIDVFAIETPGGAQPARGRARIDVRGSRPRYEVIEGDRVALYAVLRAPRGFGTPGAFDVVAQARRDGIHAIGACKSPLLVERRGRALGVVRDLAARLRQAVRRRLRQAMPPGPEQGLVRAMVLGDRTGIDPETAETFRAAGTYHVLALSGAQVALVAALLGAVLGRLELPRVLSAALTCAALLFYAELVGGQVPVARAAVMGSVLVAGKCLDLDADLANLLGLAAALLIVHRPSAVTDVAFQLSFAATLGIVLLTRPLSKGWPRLPLHVDALVAASISAQLALAPLLLAHFHRLAPAALVLNLAAIPLSSAVLLAGAAAAACPPGFVVAQRLAGDLAWVAAHALLRSADPVRLVPALDTRLPPAPAWAIVLFVGCLIALASGRRPRACAALTVVAFTALVFGRRPPAGDGRLWLSVLDVGQGDCLVLRSPRGRVWLVDAGGSYDDRFDVGEAVVAPYLWRLGVRRLDRITVTHAHPDHAGGVPFLLRSFRVDEVWEGPAPRSDRGYARLDAALRASPAVRRAVARGVRTDWDGVDVSVLGPPPAPPPWRTRNDDSVVLRLQFGSVGMILAGDIEAAGEAALVAERAQVLKVPHHGSRSSSTASFVAAISPSVAIVSVGKQNRFGHPHAEVLERYIRHGARLLRTDRDGTVTLSTDGTRLWVVDAGR